MSNPMTERSPLKRTPKPQAMLKPARSITGVSAILLPFDEKGHIEWADFEAHVARTAEAGLTPAVNMDTGYVNMLDDPTRRDVLEHTQDVMGGQSFVAGAFVADEPGDAFDLDAYRQAVDQVMEYGGTPIIFQSYGLTSQSSEDILAAYDAIGQRCDAFIAFELGRMFADFGKIYDLETYAGLLDIPACIGAKHSSLSRTLEWQRLQLRDERRPEFKVFTGNDLAIDMVMYGSDYLLGLSTFAPDLFAQRDQLWADDDPAFYELNDLLQYLGFFAFRDPVPAYKHSAAQFLKLRGWVTSSAPPSGAQRRPDSDVPILRNIAERLEAWLD
jgi:dihydrodipicolinate synthase/N-acetylneuraminate lyase